MKRNSIKTTCYRVWVFVAICTLLNCGSDNAMSDAPAVAASCASTQISKLEFGTSPHSDHARIHVFLTAMPSTDDDPSEITGDALVEVSVDDGPYIVTEQESCYHYWADIATNQFTLGIHSVSAKLFVMDESGSKLLVDEHELELVIVSR